MRAIRYMDMETLAKANELSEKIKETKGKIIAWEKGFKWPINGVLVEATGGGHYAKGAPGSFEIIKTLSLGHWRTELATLETEFKTLMPVAL